MHRPLGLRFHEKVVGVMLKPIILLLEPDAGAEKQLTDVLEGAGFEVLTASGPDAVLHAMQQRPLAALVMDAFLPNFDTPSFVRTLAQMRPDTAIVCTAEHPGLSMVLGVVRAGASDFIAKPFLPNEALERVRTAVTRRRVERSDLRELQQRLQRSEEQSVVLQQQLAMLNQNAAVGAPSTANPALTASATAFAELALQTFTALEKEHLDIVRRALPSEDPTMAARLNSHTRTFIAHHDPDFVRGVIKRGEQLGLEFKAPLATGGEILDKIGHAPGELLIIGDQLPDIPSQIVVETIQSQHPDVSIVYIEAWGTPNQNVSLLSGMTAHPVSRLMRNVSDLLGMLETARERAQEAMFSKEFTERFRGKHDAFLKKYAELTRMLNKSR
jgi:DNA-binding NtrC family response regulator